MKVIGIVANLNKRNVLIQAEKIAEMIRSNGGTVFYEQALADALGQGSPSFSLEKIEGGIEAVVVLGGDGTMIRTFRRLELKEIPLMGINLGGLGFLTEVRLDRAGEALADLLGGKLQVQQRTTLEGFYRREGIDREFPPALNDIVIGKGGLARVIQMEAFVDEEYLTSYLADGIIMSTPTGSTAYSLSAQGPIISPGTDIFLLNPICPHTLTNRPIIIEGTRSIRIMMVTAPEGTCLTIDGQIGVSLEKDDEIIVRRGREWLHLLSAPGMSFYSILRSKLKWGGRTHY